MRTPKLKANPKSQAALVLGIDTGGTYTDGMLMAYHTREVLATYKSITTKRDLSIGIEAVIEGIRIEDPALIQMVSISTTLATNAIAEKKGKRVALFLIGYDPELIAAYDMQRNFATPHYHYFEGGHDLFGREKASLDVDAIVTKVKALNHEVDAIAVSSYFSPLNPEHEIRAFEAISSVCELPVVLGHQLSTKLGSVERSTTAALNASLLSVLKEFVDAVRGAMARRGINAPLMVVRGDGTLMSEAYAARTPVETIHSGPAASAIGGRFLSRLDDALVVDIGGTTTDLALIRSGQVSINAEGATVDGYKTAVKAADLFSIALGGDSRIAFDRHNQLTVGPERVVPLACLATEHSRITDRFRRLTRNRRSNITPDHLEYWYLLREPRSERLRTEHEKKLVDLLSRGPQALSDILKALNVLSANHIGAEVLIRQEIVGKSSLTPTDLLHIDGRYSVWHTETADLALDLLARCCRLDPNDLAPKVWQKITEMLVQAMIAFLSGFPLEAAQGSKDDNIGNWFFFNSLYPSHEALETTIRLRQPIIGIGAPAAFFLEDVAAILNTDLVLPPNHEVANAVGAVAGSVVVSEDILVYPHMSQAGFEILGFYVQAGKTRHEFEDAAKALQHAVSMGKKRALDSALAAGAEEPRVVVETLSDGLDTYRICATAMGNPRLGKSAL